MQVTLDLPDEKDLPRQALEALAVEGYRTGALEHRVPLRYSETDLEDDLSAHRELGIPRER